MITEQDKQAIKDIQGTGGMRVLEYLINTKLNELDSVSNIDETQEVAAQAVGRKLAVKLLRELLSDIGVITKVKETNKTYE